MNNLIYIKETDILYIIKRQKETKKDTCQTIKMVKFILLGVKAVQT